MPEHPICGAPCPNGGAASARKHSDGDLGWMGHCNRAVPSEGARCWQHQDEDSDA